MYWDSVSQFCWLFQDQILDDLHARAVRQEQDQLKQLHYTHQTLRAQSHASILLCTDQTDMGRCENLKVYIVDLDKKIIFLYYC